MAQADVRYTTRYAWGTWFRDPASPMAHFICDLARTKTITDAMLSICEAYRLSHEEVK